MRAAGILPLLGALTGLACPAQAQDFAQVLRAERDALTAERDALRAGLEEARRSAAAAERALEADLAQLTAQLAEARAANEARSQRLDASERAHALEDEARQLAHLRDQIEAWIATRHVETSTSAALDRLVGAALDHVAAQGTLQTRPQEYFGLDGEARTGPVRRLGAVAAVAADGSTPLVQVADGTLRAAAGLDAAPVAVPGGLVVSTVVFDPDEAHTPARYAPEGWLAWMAKGGPIMWPLALLAAIGLLVALERAAALARAWVHAASGAPTAADPLLAAVAIAGEPGPLEAVEARAVEALQRAQPRLRRGVSFLGITAAVSPLIGLLGTVTGMISTFAVITEHGTGDPRLLSSGISEALLTTQLGLMVAVPALLLHTGLLRAAGAVLGRVEARALRTLEARGAAEGEGDG